MKSITHFLNIPLNDKLQALENRTQELLKSPQSCLLLNEYINSSASLNWTGDRAFNRDIEFHFNLLREIQGPILLQRMEKDLILKHFLGPWNLSSESWNELLAWSQQLANESLRLYNLEKRKENIDD
jgi:hypothetical protein